jgi:hypothetical protein
MSHKVLKLIEIFRLPMEINKQTNPTKVFHLPMELTPLNLFPLLTLKELMMKMKIKE